LATPALNRILPSCLLPVKRFFIFPHYFWGIA